MIVRHVNARMFHTPSIPHVYFPPYNQAQSVDILAKHLPPMPDCAVAASDLTWLWRQYLVVVWQSIAKGVARDLLSFKRVAVSLWLPFLQPVIDGTVKPRDISRLVVAQTRLLQDESHLGDTVLADWDTSTETERNDLYGHHELSYYSKWLMCAAYLASFNPPAQDQIYFMKTSERKRRRKGGGAIGGRKSSARKIPRHLLSPSPFSLDRLLAILHAILPHDLAPSADIDVQISTLTSLRLLLKSGILSSDMLDPSARWKVNIDLDDALKIAKELDFDIADYLSG